ncbi:hypothetical protein Tco_0807052 [Tanacetum coccineum]
MNNFYRPELGKQTTYLGYDAEGSKMEIPSQIPSEESFRKMDYITWWKFCNTRQCKFIPFVRFLKLIIEGMMEIVPEMTLHEDEPNLLIRSQKFMCLGFPLFRSEPTGPSQGENRGLICNLGSSQQSEHDDEEESEDEGDIEHNEDDMGVDEQEWVENNIEE